MLLAAGAATGQVFTLVRTLFLAYAVGVSASLDAILVAVVVPTVVGLWLASVVGVVMVPTYMRIAHDSGDFRARRFLGAVLTYVGIGALAAVILVTALADPSVAVAGPGLSPDALRLAVAHVPVLAPMLAFIAMSTMGIGVCQIGKSFTAIALAWAMGPLASLTVTVTFWDSLGITAYAIGTTAGAGMSLLVLGTAALRRGLVPRPTLRADRRDMGPFLRHVAPMIGASGILTLNLVSDRAIATLVSTGAASALTYGQQLVTGPAGALSNSWATAVYPAVVEAGGPASRTTLGAAMTTALRYTMVVFLPLAVATAALAPLIVSLLYGRGAFDREAVRTTVTVVAAFAPMLLLMMIQPVFSAAHNVRRRGTLMAVTGVFNAILNLVLNLLFSAAFGVAGIALSSSVTLAILLVFLAWQVPADEGFRIRGVTGAGGRVLAASLLPGIPIALVAWSIGLDADAIVTGLMLVAGAIVFAAGYLAAARPLAVAEPAIIVGVIRAALSRPARHASLD